MYRDDPLDDEMELREIVGDEPVDTVLDGARPDDALLAALDALRVLQGWVSDHEAGRWFVTAQKRLEGSTPIEALAAGATDDVLDAARAWAAAHG